MRVHVNFTMGFSTFTKNTIGILIGIALNLWINLYKIVLFFKSSPKDMLLLILDRKKEAGGERKDWLPPALTLIGDPTHNLDVCPDMDSNP